ncbi:SDR family oxidoreductase [Hymenobacter lapidiphilus]|uniref:SDR family oxidoreductase n=1 Tax=Hymenobacter lapidiphilus TaxID=2608003 RepID=A0A7Y7PQN3_9BACT|nr:SDR family oxidoreductase [Hymenobacter lapidiphilus]NVO32261.1 SDR family oxidoreductase [Hymenobacter lapidiphilus]
MEYAALKNKRVVVVGGSSGMGRAVAEAAAVAGARVVLASRNLARLLEVKQQLPGAVEAFAVNMLDENSVVRLFAEIGLVDHLVVTAVADETKLSAPITQLTTADAQRGMEKFWGTFFVARAAAAHMAPDGSMTFVASASIFNPSKSGISVMSAASAAVAAFGRTLAAELAPVRVNVLAPGVVNTGVWQNLSEEQRKRQAHWARESLPVRHLGEPAELAHAILFLMTNSYTTGTILSVDGGLALV